MDKIRITGGRPLEGEIRISGAKNASLPLMCASLLTAEKFSLTNIPYLADIVTMSKLIMEHGVDISMTDAHDKLELGQMIAGRTLVFQANNVTNLTAHYDIVRKMRASVLVLGPLLARFGEAKVSLPGGCAIGSRPIDLHLKAFEQMGAQIDLEQGYILAKAPDGLKGAEIHFDKVSVGATENVLMAACLAEGTTTLYNAAREPEVVDLAECLISMGAKIRGIGTATVEIDGQKSLGGTHYSVISDRIEAGTFLSCAAMAGGDITLKSAPVEAMGSVLEKYRETGVEITTKGDSIRLQSNGKLSPVDVVTQPHPGFPTDMQAQIMAMMTMTEGASTITETIFENRFMHVPELIRMGANIQIQDRSAIVRGVEKLNGAHVMATDLRASVSLLIAALATEEETIVQRIYHLDRGYENLEAKMAQCGVDIERIQ